MILSNVVTFYSSIVQSRIQYRYLWGRNVGSVGIPHQKMSRLILSGPLPPPPPPGSATLLYKSLYIFTFKQWRLIFETFYGLVLVGTVGVWSHDGAGVSILWLRHVHKWTISWWHITSSRSATLSVVKLTKLSEIIGPNY